MSTGINSAAPSLFDSLISELLNSDPQMSLIDICLNGSQKAVTSVPLRYRLIALGFVKGLDLEEVNSYLIRQGCERLYARSIFEATLIYAFNNSLSYEEWQDVSRKAFELRDEISAEGILSGKSVSLDDLRTYIMDNSEYENELAMTQHKTSMLYSGISGLGDSEQDMYKYLLSNIASFQTHRNKSRYYFCKYLMYYLETRKNEYLRLLETGDNSDTALDKLSAFKSVTVLRRKRHIPEEADKIISSASISLGTIYHAFESFYFEYTSQDWMDTLLDRYGDIGSLDAKHKKALADSLRRYKQEWSGLSDDEVLSCQQEMIDHKERVLDDPSHRASRAGENFLRKLLRGELDLDRTTLMAFLLFFDRTSDMPAAHRINGNRLNTVLAECGFPPIDTGNYVDEFFSDYLTSDDPVSFLIEEAEIMAMSEENFYLYNTYLNSKSSDTVWMKVTGSGH